MKERLGSGTVEITTMIQRVIWRFETHPPIELQRLSTHGGNEDWLLLFPPVENRARLLLEVTRAVVSVKQLGEMKMLPAGMRNP
jgi:hypothetical protein